MNFSWTTQAGIRCRGTRVPVVSRPLGPWPISRPKPVDIGTIGTLSTVCYRKNVEKPCSAIYQCGVFDRICIYKYIYIYIYILYTYIKITTSINPKIRKTKHATWSCMIHICTCIMYVHVHAYTHHAQSR